MRYQQAKKNLKEVLEYIRAQDAKIEDLQAQLETFRIIVKEAQ